MDSDDELLLAVAPESSPERQPAKRFFSFSIEPMIFFTFFCINFTSVIEQNQVIKLTCSSIFGYNKSTCDLLGTANSTAEIQNIETIVQSYVTKIVMAGSFFSFVTSTTLSLFIGSWSDKFGRKPVILAVVIGNFLSAVIVTFLTFLSTIYIISPWLYFLASIPSTLNGGICSLLTGIYCYTADTTTIKQRPIKLAIVGAYISLGLFLGSLACGYASIALSATATFGISSIIIFLVVIYVVIFVKESLHQVDNSSKIRGFFQCALVKDMLKTFVKRRPNYDRAILWIIFVILGATFFETVGSLSVFYLFVRQKFSWTIQDYSTYDATTTVALTIGGILGIVVLQKILGFSQTSLALIGIGCSVMNSVIKTAATQTWEMYLAIALSIMRGIASPMLRSMISNTVSESETGKIFALATFFEFFSGMGASPLYSFVYSSTINSFPSAFNAISAGVYFFCFILATILFGYEIRSRNDTYELLTN